MRRVWAGVLILGLAVLVLAGLWWYYPRDYAERDPKRFGVQPVPEQTEPETGFVIGGRNSTETIRKLSRINGRTIAELEADMRPAEKDAYKKWDPEKGFFPSQAGFLGPEESLIEVLAADNAYVVDEMGLTHQELGRHLRVLGAIGKKLGWTDQRGGEIVYHGQRFYVEGISYKGFQQSPFRDGTETNTDVAVYNLDNGKKLWYSLLVPEMIVRYGFYEGKGTKYRVEPREIIELCDFLQTKPRSE